MEIKDKALKIGDKVRYKKRGWSHNEEFYATVISVDDRFALLDDGFRCRANRKFTDRFEMIGAGSEFFSAELMDESDWENGKVEYKKLAEMILHKREVENWFGSYKFSFELKEELYNRFKDK